MPKRSPAENLDRAISKLLASTLKGRESKAGASRAGLAQLVRALHCLPRGEFKAALKSDLQRRIAMNEAAAPSPVPAPTVPFRRPGFYNIAPYFCVNGAREFIDFLVSAFGCTERMRVPMPDGRLGHAEVSLGDSTMELADASDAHPPRPMTIHLYVPDSDATYTSALQAGATSIYEVADQHWGDRQGCVKDPFGNVWYVATPKGWDPGEAGVRAVQPFLHLREAHRIIPFLESAFGAEALGVAKSPEGLILHATISIVNATIEIDEAHGEFQPTPFYLHVYVPDTDALYARALSAGATSVTAPNDAPYGDRTAAVKDAFGNTWFLATYHGPDAVA